MNLNISIMQGRLLPKFENRFQAYPALNWQDEFYKAQKLNLYSIEWIFEKPHEDVNALATTDGIEKIKQIIDETKVEVKSICADYYMTELLVKDGKAIQANWLHLEWLCKLASNLDIQYIILPFVDSSSLKSYQDIDCLVDSLKQFLNRIVNLKLEIHLETDLKPLDFLKIFKDVNNSLLKLNYDIGNSASLGYDPDEELSILGEYLGSIHIKDRILNGSTIELGQGNANFKNCFKWFKNLNYNRWFVLQAARGTEGLEEQTVHKQIEFVKRLWN